MAVSTIGCVRLSSSNLPMFRQECKSIVIMYRMDHVRIIIGCSLQVRGYFHDWRLAQHGVWDPSSDQLLRKDYFAKRPRTGEPLDYDKFTNSYFLEHYRAYRDALRSVWPGAIMLCQPPVMEIPPDLKGTIDDDPNMVHAVHYYDGLTLLTKHW